MKLKQKEISDLIWLGRRLDKVLNYLVKENSNLKDSFLNYVKIYFIPIIEGIENEEEENYYFEEMDSIVDELEQLLSQKFETIIR